MDFVCNDKSFETLLDLDWGGQILLNGFPANLNEMKRKSNDYKSFYELNTDAKWLLHTWIINFPNKKKVNALIGKLIKYIDDEVTNLKACRECYVNAQSLSDAAFVVPCNPPHLCVWAKYKEFCYWPCKVMYTEGQMVHVRFFGDHCKGMDMLEKNAFVECGAAIHF